LSVMPGMLKSSSGVNVWLRVRNGLSAEKPEDMIVSFGKTAG